MHSPHRGQRCRARRFRVDRGNAAAGLDPIAAAVPVGLQKSVDHEGFSAYCIDIGIMLAWRLAMIQMEPVMTRKTISTPKASAMILFVLSGPLPRCRKKTR